VDREEEVAVRIGKRAVARWGRLAALGSSLAACARPSPGRAPPAPSFDAVVLARAVRDSMNVIFARANEHWDELGEVNTLTQMLGTGKPTQLEYLGCLTGRTERDTLWISDWTPARDMKRLQFAVTGSCDGVVGTVGTWHTHPYRAGSDRRVLKEPRLSPADLATFAAGGDLIVIAVWDVDSLDVAARAPGRAVRHPVAVEVR
jgi:hypothetical protein